MNRRTPPSPCPGPLVSGAGALAALLIPLPAAAQHQVVGGYRLDRNPMVGSAGLNSGVDRAAAFRTPSFRTGAIDLSQPSAAAFRDASRRIQRPLVSGLQIGGDEYVSYYDPRTGATVLRHDPLATAIYTPLDEPVYIDRGRGPSLRASPAGRIDTSIRTRAGGR